MKSVTFGEVAEVIAGQSPEGIFYNSGAIGMLFYQGKKEFGEKFLGKPTTWTTKVTKVAARGDILMSVRAPVGPINFATEEICIGRGLAAIRAGKEVDRDFLFYFLLYQQPKIAGNTGAVFDSINRDQIAGIELFLPSLPEQTAIVERLDAAFVEIGKLQVGIEKKILELESLFNSFLGSRFSESQNAGSEKLVPRKLSAIAIVVNGRAYSQPELLSKGKFRVLRVGNFFTNKNWYYSDLELPADKYCEKGDLLYAWSASFGPRIWQEEKVIYHYHIWKIIEDPKVVCKKWLYWWLYWDAASIKRIHGTGTTMTHITKGAMESRNMLLPGLEHQVEITNGIDALAAEIEILRNGFVKQQDLYNSLRQAILSEIFRQEANVS